MVPASSGKTSSPITNFSPLKTKLAVEKTDTKDYEYGSLDDASSYGIMAQALIGGTKEDCVTTTDPEEAAPIPAMVEHETQLKNIFYAHILILVVLFVVLVANAREGKLILCLLFC